MNPQQLRETTMHPATRSLIEVTLPGPYEERQAARDIVERLMGRDPSARFDFIQARASAVEDDAIDA
jgi:topoisomerase-4 subunit B